MASRVKRDRRALEAFLRRGRALETRRLRVGVLDMQERYPPGHVGRKSRATRQRDRQDQKHQDNTHTPPSRSSEPTPVATVAQVLNAKDKYHDAAIAARRAEMPAEMAKVRDILLRGDPTNELKAVGRRTMIAIRNNLRRMGHVDTGRLVRAIESRLERG